MTISQNATILAQNEPSALSRSNRRLAYLTTGRADINPTWLTIPTPLEDRWVLGEFRSGTVCSTDKSNAYSALGHNINPDQPKIIGHESCFQVIQSRNPFIKEGQFIVPLGDDWFGFTETEKFLPILPATDLNDIPLEFSERATYFDPTPHVKAACVFDEWFSGVSLIEPYTHVLASFLYSKRLTFADTLLVLGGGFCGLAACKLAKMFGVRRVIVMDVNQTRIDFAVRNGFADDGLDPRDVTAVEALVRKTSGAYADVVFDALPGIASGTLNTRSLAAQLLKPDGAWIMYSAADNMTLPTITFLAKGIHMSGCPYDSRLISFSRRASLMGVVHGLISAGRLPVDVFIARSVDFFDEQTVSEAVLQYGDGPDIKIEIRR